MDGIANKIEIVEEKQRPLPTMPTPPNGCPPVETPQYCDVCYFAGHHASNAVARNVCTPIVYASTVLEVSGSEVSLDYPEVENDQMRALDILAAYYVKLGHKERTSKERKRDLFSKATLLYTTADRIKMYDMPHLTGRAYFCLVEERASKVDQADQQFNFVLKQVIHKFLQPDNRTECGHETRNILRLFAGAYDIPAMMGKAIIAFSKQDYKTALYFLKRALRQKPDGPADMRVGIGYCLARLGLTDKARIAFERALELQNDNGDTAYP
ncbi:unnamed protein product [Cylicocyclus nassatus]|uniref:Tetratricopeptide repeat protein n=1 Tax=Cylicocyclus nassatus TaxID=53992 RepID=A0AA36DW25_CYLNA|nr:unnamed protein product [Cylicocyclus nassatus]